MKSKAILLLCFILTLTIAAGMAWYNLELDRRVITGNRKFDVELIQKMIDEDSLSDLEAEHYLTEEKIRDAR